MLLYKTYSDAKCGLVYHSAWQLLLATILSAQTKDENVNKVTKVLFSKCPTVKDIQEMEESELQKIIYSCGFYRNKARNIKRASDFVIKEFGGKIPASMDDLLKIPGVARKTANVVLSEWFKQSDGIVVDTHVKRISKRIGWTKHTDPKKIEKDLMSIIPKKYWLTISHILIEHGRKICTGPNPKCEQCPVRNNCIYYSLGSNNQEIHKKVDKVKNKH